MSRTEINKERIRIFTDGACSGNPGPGGWGAIVSFPHEVTTELGGRADHTTNNAMELQAITSAMQYIAGHAGDVSVYTDSKYIVNGITKWIKGWKRNNWKTMDGKPVANKDLWQQLGSHVDARKHTIDWHYVPGHKGVAGNERADDIAVAYCQENPINLFNGKTDDYKIDLTHISPSDQNPFYLSLVHGKLEQHESWAACEHLVKGVSDAKYKKVKSSSEAIEVLRNWGLNPNDYDF